jgi:hypothetical protein
VCIVLSSALRDWSGARRQRLTERDRELGKQPTILCGVVITRSLHGSLSNLSLDTASVVKCRHRWRVLWAVAMLTRSLAAVGWRISLTSGAGGSGSTAAVLATRAFALPYCARPQSLARSSGAGRTVGGSGGRGGDGSAHIRHNALWSWSKQRAVRDGVPSACPHNLDTRRPATSLVHTVLPKGAWPYAELMRLDKPIGTWLL